MENNGMMNNGSNGIGFWGLLIAVVLFFFFIQRSNECPNGYCQDMSTRESAAVTTQTQLDSAIRTEKELCDQNTLILQQNSQTRELITKQRSDYLQDELNKERMQNQTLLLQSNMNAQFCATNAAIERLNCTVVKKPDFIACGCLPACQPYVCNGNPA